MRSELNDENWAPISLEVVVAKLPQSGLPVSFEADGEQREALAKHMGILGVERFTAKLTLRRWQRDGVSVDGRVRTTVIQACVVTLDPLHEEIDEAVDFIFVPETSKLARIVPDGEGELHLDPEGADLPETFRGDRIDLGSFLTEIVALALNPYPRSGSAEFSELDTDPDADGGRVSPFATLKQLRTPNS